MAAAFTVVLLPAAVAFVPVPVGRSEEATGPNVEDRWDRWLAALGRSDAPPRWWWAGPALLAAGEAAISTMNVYLPLTGS